VKTTGSIYVGSTGEVSSHAGNSAAAPGAVHLRGTVIDVAGTLDVGGASGGWLTLTATQQVTIRVDVDADATGSGGTGGSIEISADAGIEIDGRLLARGKSVSSQASGDGGQVDLLSRGGDILIKKNILAVASGTDANGDAVVVEAGGSVVIETGAEVSASTNGGEGQGGEVKIVAELDISAAGTLRTSGGGEGGGIALLAGRNISITRPIYSKGIGAGGLGGAVSIEAGTSQSGSITIDAEIDAGGGICGTSGCGAGGEISISACGVALTPGASIQTRGADGGKTLISVRALLSASASSHVNSSSNVSASQGVDGSNVFRHPASVPPAIAPGAVIVPAAIVQPVEQAPCTP
jgi:hypothetical protein